MLQLFNARCRCLLIVRFIRDYPLNNLSQKRIVRLRCTFSFFATISARAASVGRRDSQAVETEADYAIRSVTMRQY